jgi:MFS family permease
MVKKPMPNEAPHPLRTAWKNKNLRLYFSGQVVSLVGTWMQQMAVSWLVYRLTNSPLMLGLIGFASQAPSLVVTPIAGIVVDRSNRHRLLIITQALAMVQAALLAAVVCAGHPQLWQLVTLSAVLGMITAFDLPTRQSFIVDMLDDNEQLTSAIAINSSINTLTRLIGPFVAGLCVAAAGEGMCFLLNALSYVAVIAALFFVKSRQRSVKPSGATPLAQLKEGFVYAFGYPPIRDLIVFIALFGLCAIPAGVLLPVFAKDVFHGDASTFGFLSGASGGGALIAALCLASRKQGARGLSRWIIQGCVVTGISLVAFGLSTNLILSLLLVAVSGFGSVIAIAASNTVIQTIVEESKRGRVMSFVVMAFLGVAPFGCMAAGALANVVGSGLTMIFGGVLILALALVFAKRLARISGHTEPPRTQQEELVPAESELAAANA